jgi:hypothetical protein
MVALKPFTRSDFNSMKHDLSFEFVFQLSVFFCDQLQDVMASEEEGESGEDVASYRDLCLELHTYLDGHPGCKKPKNIFWFQRTITDGLWIAKSIVSIGR